MCFSVPICDRCHLFSNHTRVPLPVTVSDYTCERERGGQLLGGVKPIVSTQSSCLASLPWVSPTHSVSQHLTRPCTHLTGRAAHSHYSSLSWFVHSVHSVSTCMFFSVCLSLWQAPLHRLNLKVQICSVSCLWRTSLSNVWQLTLPKKKTHKWQTTILHQYHLAN